MLPKKSVRACIQALRAFERNMLRLNRETVTYH